MNVKTLPKAEYETIMSCPDCGWSGNNSDDCSSTFHEMIEERETERGKKYYHCTACECDFQA